MKTTLLIIFLVFSAAIIAQEQPCDPPPEMTPTQKALVSYERCLKHENQGVVESAICNVLLFKHLNPDVDMCHLESLIEDLSKNSDNEDIRRKALLVSNILKNPQLVARIDKKYYKNVEEFFDILTIGASLDNVNLQALTDNDSDQ